ncbi:MAG: hypothetical protein Q9M22_07050 [Mariprofundaceae bacterium]|nr:hypothetical protein [Mariprofundaceae bacterium]
MKYFKNTQQTMIETWLALFIRQIIFYMLPVMVSLTMVSMLESRLTGQPISHPFHAIAWKNTWWPMLAGMVFHRAVIIALPQPFVYSFFTASIRCAGHCLCLLAGFFLYSWVLQHQAPTGLPPLHQWWAKVFMYFNLCMAVLHLLPMPGMVVGEWLYKHGYFPALFYAFMRYYQHWFWLLIGALPLLDMVAGKYIIYPTYGWLATLA